MWPMLSVDAVADISAGNPAPQAVEDFADDGEPFIRMQDVGRMHHTSNLLNSVDRVSARAIDRYRLRLYPAGSVLIPKSGASVNLNHRAMLGRDAYVVSHLAVLVPRTDRILPEYLYYWSLTYDPRHQAQTTSLPSLPLSLIKTAAIRLPPIAEQRRIVNLLSRAEGIVMLQRDAKIKAAELLPAIFLDMFGDPTTNPRCWPTTPLGTLIENGPQNGLYKHASLYGEGTPILRIDGFYNGRITGLDSLRRLRVDSDEREKYCLHTDDIIINRVNSPEYLAKSALVPQLAEETVFESNMMRFSVDQSRISPRYLMALLQTSYARSHFLSRAKHAINQSSVNQQDVTALSVPLPPLLQQQTFALRCDQLGDLAAQIAIASSKAIETFDSLLNRVFSIGYHE